MAVSLPSVVVINILRFIIKEVFSCKDIQTIEKFGLVNLFGWNTYTLLTFYAT